VFLPAGTTGAFTVTVRPTNTNSDGVPNNGDATDQDFALVIYNGEFPPRNPVDIILVLDVSGSMSYVGRRGEDLAGFEKAYQILGEVLDGDLDEFIQAYLLQKADKECLEFEMPKLPK
jgi:hypothetical protein